MQRVGPADPAADCAAGEGADDWINLRRHHVSDVQREAQRHLDALGPVGASSIVAGEPTSKRPESSATIDRLDVQL
jgi:hypothetical protein